MKAFVCYSILLLLGFTAQAQSFAIVNDPDGFVNVREEKSLKSKVIQKINDGQILLIEDTDGKPDNWAYVAGPTLTIDYKTDKKIDNTYSGGLKGYVYKNRLISIETLPHPL